MDIGYEDALRPSSLSLSRSHAQSHIYDQCPRGQHRCPASFIGIASASAAAKGHLITEWTWIPCAAVLGFLTLAAIKAWSVVAMSVVKYSQARDYPSLEIREGKKCCDRVSQTGTPEGSVMGGVICVH